MDWERRSTDGMNTSRWRAAPQQQESKGRTLYGPCKAQQINSAYCGRLDVRMECSKSGHCSVAQMVRSACRRFCVRDLPGWLWHEQPQAFLPFQHLLVPTRSPTAALFSTHLPVHARLPSIVVTSSSFISRARIAVVRLHSLPSSALPSSTPSPPWPALNARPQTTNLRRNINPPPADALYQFTSSSLHHHHHRHHIPWIELTEVPIVSIFLGSLVIPSPSPPSRSPS